MSVIRTIAVCLLLGFIISTLVAQILGLVAHYNDSSSSAELLIEPPEPPQRFRDRGAGVNARAKLAFGAVRRGWYFDEGFSVTYAPGLPFDRWRPTNAKWWNFPGDQGPYYGWTPGGHPAWGRLFRVSELVDDKDWVRFSGVEDARGFPALCYWHGIRKIDSRSRFSTPGGILLSGSDASQVGNLQVKAIALRPIWGGLAFNTAFYGGLAFLIWYIARGLREHRRYQRGWCIRCSYDLKSDYSARCSECGWGRA